MEFELKDDFIELIKLLKVTSLVGSGGEAKIHVSEGQVKLNGEVEFRKRAKIKAGDKVEFQGQIIQVK